MDAHFREYLAAVAGMQDVYGERGDDHPTEFHDDTVPAFAQNRDQPISPSDHLRVRIDDLRRSGNRHVAASRGEWPPRSIAQPSGPIQRRPPLDERLPHPMKAEPNTRCSADKASGSRWRKTPIGRS